MVFDLEIEISGQLQGLVVSGPRQAWRSLQVSF